MAGGPCLKESLPKPVAATLVVSASDSLYLERADYICDGVADDVEINAALAAINAAGIGGCVELLEGTYTLADPIIFPGNNLVLKGQGPGSFIDGDGLATTEHGIVISGRTDCTVQDLSIQTEDGGGKLSHCIFLEDGPDRTKIIRVTVLDSDSDAIHIEGTNTYDIVIEGCVVRDVDDHGVYLDMDADNSLWRLSILNNTILGAGGEGVEFVAPGGTGHYYEVVIQGNLFFTSGFDGLEAVDIQWGTIDGNISFYNTVNGIEVTNCFDVVVSNNVCLHNGEDGIEFDGTTARCSAVGNICCENGAAAAYAGIDIGTVSDCLVEGNYCYNNQQFGIIVGVGGAGRNSVIGNVCALNYREGIADAGQDNLIQGNYIYDNGQEAAGTYHGIILTNNCIRGSVVGNYISSPGDSQEDGIHLEDGATHILIQGNYCYNGMGSGICLAANNSDCQINGNYCYVNDDFGIEILDGSDRCMVNNNKCEANGGHGIYLNANDYCSLVGNNCNNNTGANTDGINLNGCDYCIISSNVCTGNGDDGIVLVATSIKCIIIGNQLLGNTGAALTDGGTNTEKGHNITV